MATTQRTFNGQTVGLALFKELLAPRADSVHLLVWGTLTGTMVWHGFIGGPVSYKTLPRQTFGNLQNALFKVYFALTTGLTALLLGIFAKHNPVVTQRPTEILHPVTYQAFTLLTSAVAGAVNWLYLGPKTSEIMYRRHRLERAEGKNYNDAGVSAEMQALTKQFGSLHGLSSLLNLAQLGGILFHGAWLARYGLFSKAT